MAFAEYDDLEVEAPQPKSNLRKYLSFGVLAVAVALGSTLAANINLGGSGSVEFGQGIVQTTACSGNTALTITPRAAFTNSSGAGTYYFKSITVTNIPVGCAGSDFQLNAYDSSTASSLALYDSTGQNVIVYDSGSGFQVGGGLTGYTVSSGSDSFTVTFTVPVALAKTVEKITIQSAVHAIQASEVCGSNGQRASGGACRIGDIGSGGGTIFYVNSGGFTATGSACNTNCHYLEFAPKGWASLSAVPQNISYNGQVMGTRTDANVDPILVYSDGNFTNQARSTVAIGTAVGTGYQNTQQMKNNTTLGVHDERFSFLAALAYAGNSGTSTAGEWFMPSLLELNELCKFARGQTSDLGNTSIECSPSTGTLNTAYGFTPIQLYMSSTYGLQADGQMDGYFFYAGNNSTPLRNLYYAQYGNAFRPVRVS
jgi:hypothetical protein